MKRLRPRPRTSSSGRCAAIDGYLDTNVLVHALANDPLSGECRAFLLAVEEGRARVRIEAVVLHELSYVLPRFLQGLTREGVARRLLRLLSLEGVEGDKDLLVDTVERWRRTAGLGFVDAYLAAISARDALPVFTKNVRELTAQGATVPDPLPS